MKIKAIFTMGFLLVANFANAGVSSGWFDYAVGKIGSKGVDTLSLMTENGLILSRIKKLEGSKYYAAYSFGESRLSDKERKSEPLDLSEFDFLIEFETCNGNIELLSGEVYKARYRYHTAEGQALADEIIDINEFFYRVSKKNGTILSATKEKFKTNYTLSIWQKVQNVSFSFNLSKERHYIELEASAGSVCQN